MAVKSSIGVQGKKLNEELDKKITSFKSIKKGEVNIIPKKKVTDVIFEPGVNVKPIPKIVTQLTRKFGLTSANDNSYDFGTFRGGKAITHRVNFIIKKISKKTPPRIFEKGTTVVFNRALKNNKKFKSGSDILNDPQTKKLLDDVFKGYEGELTKWSHTFYEQQKEFLNEFGKNDWSPFEYGNKQDFVKFFSDQIRRVGRTLTKDDEGNVMVIEPVGRYEVWNPSDVWAAYKLPEVQKDIKKSLSPETKSLAKLNSMLVEMFEDRRLVGISLKLIGKGKEAKLVYRNDKPENMKIANIEKLDFKDIVFKLDTIWEKPTVTTVYLDYGPSYGMNVTRSDSGLTFSTQVRRTAAQGGNTPVDMVIKLLEEHISNNTYTKNINKYPKSFEQFIDKVEEYEKLYNIVKPYFNGAPPFGGTGKSFVSVIEEAFKSKTKTDKGSVNGTGKLMLLSFFGNAFKITNKKKKKEFWTDILYMGMKVGGKGKGEFAPHVKIGEKSS